MKRMTSKLISLLCVVCMMISLSASVLAADSTPSVTAVMNTTGKKAEIRLSNIGIMIYSAQVTLNINGKDVKFEITPTDKSAQSTITQTDNTVTLYVDTMNLMDGTEEISLASLSSDNKMEIGATADLIIIDRSMNSFSYDNVKVNVTSEPQATTKPSSSGGGGGGSSSSSTGTGMGIIANTKPNSSQTQNPDGTGNVTTVLTGFEDVEDSFWAKDSIEYVVSRGLFEGTSDTTFEPNISMTRSMYVSVLSRFGTKIGPEWQIACDTPMYFDDVKDSDWFGDAVSWAGGIGLVSGIGNNAFGPYNPVTREQIAVMTVNFASLCGKELPSDIEAVSFTDAESINDWAKDAVRAAQQAGIIYGREDGSFAPQDTATRAEVAAILHRFVEIFE